jgi:hypothetical protein
LLVFCLYYFRFAGRTRIAAKAAENTFFSSKILKNAQENKPFSNASLHFSFGRPIYATLEHTDLLEMATTSLHDDGIHNDCHCHARVKRTLTRDGFEIVERSGSHFQEGSMLKRRIDGTTKGKMKASIASESRRKSLP